MKVAISKINFDYSIQCRVSVDSESVTEYAEKMNAGEKFPPIDIFKDGDMYLIGDGVHRASAARQAGIDKIDAVLHEGGRQVAIKFACGANTIHGLKRTNADKRRAVEIALREFPKLSSRAIADMCGVNKNMVERGRDGTGPKGQSTTRTSKDGRELPAHPVRSNPEPDMSAIEDDGEEEHAEDGVCHMETQEAPGTNVRMKKAPRGLSMANAAIMCLEEIPKKDKERDEAFNTVQRWIENQRRSI